MISIENGVTFDSRVARGSGELVAITVTHRTVLGTRRLFMACVPRTGPIVWPHSESMDTLTPSSVTAPARLNIKVASIVRIVDVVD